jgi:hypothetical protein
MWRRVEIVLTDVSKERIASIFMVEDKKKSASEPARAGATCNMHLHLQGRRQEEIRERTS